MTLLSTKRDENTFRSRESAYEKIFRGFQYRQLRNTHAKVLTKDSEFAAVTGFNWFSFKGDPHRFFRDEQGTLLQVPELVNQNFAELEPRFAAAKLAQP